MVIHEEYNGIITVVLSKGVAIRDHLGRIYILGVSEHVLVSLVRHTIPLLLHLNEVDAEG